jgi:hypothetical protein
MKPSEPLNYSLFTKEREYIKNCLGDETWVTAYSYSHDKQQTISFHCGLIRNCDVPKALTNASCDIQIGSGFPGCSTYGIDDNRVVTYDRFGFETAEPLLFQRDYSGFKESNTEISEEFRFFHNLYYEVKRNEYIKLDVSGEETAVVRFENGAVLIRLKEIRQFLAIKEMHLALFFDHFRRSNVDVSTIPEKLRDVFFSDERIVYRLRVWADNLRTNNFATASAIYGKKMIKPFPKSKSDFWPYDRDQVEEFEEFIIGESADSEPLMYTCDHKKLANYFGANPEAPNYLTPVYFKRDVLQKYYNAPERFSVEDCYLRCGGQWGLRMDNNYDDVVIVYLGDLGRDLPAKERSYWKSFNILPKGGISRTKYMRDFMAEACDPEGKDLLSKLRYQQLNEKWVKKHGWPLFLPLKKEDEHYFQNLRVLLNNSQSEFDSQVLALAKVLVSALNEKEIEKNISEMPDPPHGIAKLSVFLRENGYCDYEEGIDLLKLIQGLRSSGVAHLKGSNYQKLSEKFGLVDKELRDFFSDLLSRSNKFLEQLISDTDKTINKSNL